MRLSELSRTSGVSVATIKYYQREGLLPPGEALSRTDASYGPVHVDRLRLLRALRRGGALPLTRIRAVIALLDGPHDSTDGVADAARSVLIPVPAARVENDGTAESFLAERGWTIGPDDGLARSLGWHLGVLEAGGLPTSRAALHRWADACEGMATADFHASAADPTTAVQQFALTLAATEPLLLTLRRLVGTQLIARHLDR